MGLAGNGRCCCRSEEQELSYGISAGEIRTRDLRPGRPGRRSTEVTDIFTTAGPMLSHWPLMGTLGNGRYRLSVTTTQGRPCGGTCAGPRAYLFRGRIPVRVSKAGGITRFALRRSIRHLHHQRRLSRDHSRQTELQKIYRGAVDAPPFANPLGSLCHRCPAHRLVPSGRPRALGHAPSQREPRDPGLPFRPMPGCSVGPRGGQQKTLRSGRLGRVREKRTVDLAVRQDRSHEPGMRHRIALGYSACGQFFRSGATSLGSWCLSQTEVFARARDIRPRLVNVKRSCSSKLR